MRTRMGFVIVFLISAVVSAAEHNHYRIEKLKWLTGCWQATSAERTVEEVWMAPRGGSMMGMGRTVRADSLVEYELVIIREQGDRLVYKAHPSGQSSAEFVLKSISENRFEFENAAHDFPQRIGYERRGSDLRAWIEGTRDGRTQKIEFPYRRVACPGD